MPACKICGSETNCCFNIRLERTPICDYCANSICLQQVSALVLGRKEVPKTKGKNLAKRNVADSETLSGETVEVRSLPFESAYYQTEREDPRFHSRG